MTAKRGGEQRVKTAKTVFSITETISELGGARLTDIAEHLDMANSTLYAHLATLEDLGYLVKEDGEYQLSLQCLDYGIRARDRYDIVDASRSTLKQLADTTGELAWIVVEERGKVVYLSHARGSNAIQTYKRIGKHEEMHCLAGGKAILAHLSEQRVSEIIDQHGLPAKTDHTITDESTLLEELEQVRDQGYSVNRGEAAEGVYAIGAPILTDDDVRGAVTVSGPENRLQTGENGDLVELVKAASNEIELKLIYGT